MQVVFESYDAAKSVCDKTNRNRKRPLSVYRISAGEHREKFVIAISPEQALGRAGESFGLVVERWPRPRKETPKSILEGMTLEQKRALLAELLSEHVQEQGHRPEGEDEDEG